MSADLVIDTTLKPLSMPKGSPRALKAQKQQLFDAAAKVAKFHGIKAQAIVDTIGKPVKFSRGEVCIGIFDASFARGDRTLFNAIFRTLNLMGFATSCHLYETRTIVTRKADGSCKVRFSHYTDHLYRMPVERGELGELHRRINRAKPMIDGNRLFVSCYARFGDEPWSPSRSVVALEGAAV